jgi:hypothetical protein
VRKECSKKTSLYICRTAGQIGETMAQSRVGQTNEGDLGNDNPFEGTFEGHEAIKPLDQCYSEFRRQNGYPEEKMNNLACPVHKWRPDLYRSITNSSCQGYGFKAVGPLK